MIQPNFFLIDLLDILPEDIDCFIQAPSLENIVIKEMLQDTEYDYYKLLKLNNTNKKIFIKQELETSFSMHIQNIKINKDRVLLFEGYDGVEYGSISQNICIPDWFKEKYFPDYLMGFL
ncbi:MAG: hypothetical protein QM564_01275 [Bergeyella sp.]